ncbi:inositol 1,4,5-trisphosphate receptor-interacting protein-like 1 isoform X2 [Catharus ustulatus]|uniref:inositol 1,4,5-trisphosphate receptor-interacting protein-like 1 isoform X2 n=1 Tax=Catharus ustulatus TaxID=91951 RepID=UPI00140C6955|nr:inositol 1,4,5-trisphosphate receptor-interacting protein-like 1 isoform X2 [Catharus ustulatus]
MLRTTFLLLLVQGLLQYPQQAGDGLDEAARERMQQRADFLNQEMAQLMQELEQDSLEHSGVAWGALLVWQFWAVTGLLVLLLALWFGLHKIRWDPDNSGLKESSSSNLEEEEEEGHNVFAKREAGNDSENVEEDNKDGNEEGSNADAEEDNKDGNGEGTNADVEEANKDGNGEGTNADVEEDNKDGNGEGTNADVEEDNKDGNGEGCIKDAKAESNMGNEVKEGSDDAKEEVNRNEKEDEVNAAGNKAQEGSDDANEEVNNSEKGENANVDGNEEGKDIANEEDDGHNVKRNLGSLLEERLHLPALDLDKGCSIITDLMDKLTDIFGQSWSNSFYPVPQEAIGVGSAFEGWSPRAEDLVYHVLVPLSPPPGHAFHLELDTAGVLQRNGCVHVELLCTCTREQLGEDMLCFLHSSEEELRRDQDPSLLDTLCTDSYLDVEKTVHWFYQFMKEAWVLLPQSRHWRLRLLPSSRSCKFQLRKDQESLMVEVILGVRQGDSDIFVGSQPAEVAMPSITWLETYAVAEAKFFRHISRQAPHDSWHCKCLQLLSRILTGGGFSSYALKTVLMHLLNTIPLTQWGRKDFRWRILNIVMYLRCSLDAKQLNHFVLGNERFPMDISLPSDLRVAESPNLFQHLASSPDAHKKAMQEYGHLLHQLEQMLF